MLDYWRTASEDLAAEAVDSPVRKAYAKMATAQSNLFAQRGLEAEAEAGYRLAREMAPNLPEAVAGLAAVLDKSGRSSEAATLLQTLPRKSGSSTGR